MSVRTCFQTFSVPLTSMVVCYAFACSCIAINAQHTAGSVNISRLFNVKYMVLLKQNTRLPSYSMRDHYKCIDDINFIVH